MAGLQQHDGRPRPMWVGGHDDECTKPPAQRVLLDIFSPFAAAALLLLLLLVTTTEEEEEEEVMPSWTSNSFRVLSCSVVYVYILYAISRPIIVKTHRVYIRVPLYTHTRTKKKCIQ